MTTTQQARGLALQTIADAMAFGEMLARSEFSPKDFRGKPESCVLAIQHGAEIGLSPMQAIQSIAVINGKPSIYGDSMKAICLASAVCEWITEEVEGDGESMVGVCKAQRRGNPTATISRFSVADAKKAGLWGKSGPWTAFPKRMLQMRARSFCLRDAFPDVLKGLIAAEEAQDYPTPEPVREPVVVRTRATPQPHPEPVVRIEQKTETAPTLFERAMAKIQRAGDRETLEGCLNRIDELRRDEQLTADEAARLVAACDGRMEIFAAPASTEG